MQAKSWCTSEQVSQRPAACQPRSPRLVVRANSQQATRRDALSALAGGEAALSCAVVSVHFRQLASGCYLAVLSYLLGTPLSQLRQCSSLSHLIASLQLLCRSPAFVYAVLGLGFAAAAQAKVVIPIHDSIGGANVCQHSSVWKYAGSRVLPASLRSLLPAFGVAFPGRCLAVCHLHVARTCFPTGAQPCKVEPRFCGHNSSPIAHHPQTCRRTAPRRLPAGTPWRCSFRRSCLLA